MMTTKLVRSVGLALCEGLLASACGGDAAVSPSVDASMAVAMDAGIHPGSEPCSEGTTRSCACATGSSGLSTCHDGAFDACSACDAGTPARCTAGRYEGSFQMTYRSTPGGFCGVVSELTENPATGAWTFNLTEGAGEFSYVVSGGCLSSDGTAADGGVTKTPPIHASIEGLVDCATGKLDGMVKGTYRAASVCSLGTQVDNYFFEGTLSGTFDPTTGSFVDTMVQWAEPHVLVGPQPGGTGTWSARLVPGAPLGDQHIDCLGGVAFPDDLFVDAGS